MIRHLKLGSKATGSGKSTSNTTGGGSQEGASEGSSSGKTRGWSPALFHLSFFTSKQKTRNTQSGTSSSTNENWARAVQEQQNETNTEGWTQQLHKKPLADIHELMQMFGAIDDQDAPNFPGVGLISTAEKAPALIQKSFYDQDRDFEGMFDPHPKHGFTELSKPTPEPKLIVEPRPKSSYYEMEIKVPYENCFFVRGVRAHDKVIADNALFYAHIVFTNIRVYIGAMATMNSEIQMQERDSTDHIPNEERQHATGRYR